MCDEGTCIQLNFLQLSETEKVQKDKVWSYEQSYKGQNSQRLSCFTD